MTELLEFFRDSPKIGIWRLDLAKPVLLGGYSLKRPEQLALSWVLFFDRSSYVGNFDMYIGRK